MQSNKYNFVIENSPDGGFLQSDRWAKFQMAIGRKLFSVKKYGFWANVVEHKLPIVGKYFYIPRGPIVDNMFPIEKQIEELADIATKNNAGWIRIDPSTSDLLEDIKKFSKYKIVKAPHDMQPKELFIIDITKTEDELLQEMKPKTRYNIRLAEKKGVKIFVSREKKIVDRFFELVEITSKRQGIVSHEKNYYEKMIESIPEENMKIFCAQIDQKIVAANLVLFFGNTATYLHGASDDSFRSTMAPYLLQWKQIQSAKAYGAKKYDFGGIKTSGGKNDWAGITRFKQSFSPKNQAIVFPGTYDIIINRFKYGSYRIIQKIRCIL